jgi:hypothetical protein
MVMIVVVALAFACDAHQEQRGRHLAQLGLGHGLRLDFENLEQLLRAVALFQF